MLMIFNISVYTIFILKKYSVYTIFILEKYSVYIVFFPMYTL